jgi:hypothetical protein
MPPTTDEMSALDAVDGSSTGARAPRNGRHLRHGQARFVKNVVVPIAFCRILLSQIVPDVRKAGKRVNNRRWHGRAGNAYEARWLRRGLRLLLGAQP